MKAEFTERKEQLRKINSDCEKKAKVRQKERGELENRISNLEKKLEKQEKAKRRNSIVIKGNKFGDDRAENQNLRQVKTDFILKEMEADGDKYVWSNVERKVC